MMRRRGHRVQQGDWQHRPSRALSPLEREFMGLLCSGLPLAKAAEEAGISHGAAANRRHCAYQKLAVHDLAKACAKLASLERVQLLRTGLARQDVVRGMPPGASSSGIAGQDGAVGQAARDAGADGEGGGYAMTQGPIVHIFKDGTCTEGVRPYAPAVDETAWVTIPHEPDPRGSQTPVSWHYVTECPFAPPLSGGNRSSAS